MDIINSPFLKFSPDDIPRPWLPVILKNPHTGNSFGTYGLIDTGADECAIPASFDPFLGHDLFAVRPKTVDTGNGPTIAYPHTVCFETKGIVIKDVLIDFMPNLSSVLLGVSNFLNRFEVIIDYKNLAFSLKQN